MFSAYSLRGLIVCQNVFGETWANVWIRTAIFVNARTEAPRPLAAFGGFFADVGHSAKANYAGASSDAPRPAYGNVNLAWSDLLWPGKLDRICVQLTKYAVASNCQLAFQRSYQMHTHHHRHLPAPHLTLNWTTQVAAINTRHQKVYDVVIERKEKKQDKEAGMAAAALLLGLAFSSCFVGGVR